MARGPCYISRKRGRGVTVSYKPVPIRAGQQTMFNIAASDNVFRLLRNDQVRTNVYCLPLGVKM